jgi:hypothetical protein
MADHENIEHPDKHQFGDHLQKQLVMLRAEYQYLEGKYDRVCADLNAIINRAEAGQVVYVVMPNGGRLYLKKCAESVEKSE